jgi:hypothetical protein
MPPSKPAAIHLRNGLNLSSPSAGVKKSADVLGQAALEGLKKELDTMAPGRQKVMRQTRDRILRGVTASAPPRRRSPCRRPSGAARIPFRLEAERGPGWAGFEERLGRCAKRDLFEPAQGGRSGVCHALRRRDPTAPAIAGGNYSGFPRACGPGQDLGACFGVAPPPLAPRNPDAQMPTHAPLTQQLKCAALSELGSNRRPKRSGRSRPCVWSSCMPWAVR